MRNCGMTDDSTGKTACAAKHWPENQCTAAYLLFSFGTEPDPLSVYPAAQADCLRKAEGILQQLLEELATDTGRSDRTYVATRISDALRSINAQIYAIRCYLGQSIDLGGAIVFLAGREYVLFPFGGGNAALWAESILSEIHTQHSPGTPAKYALGSAGTWNGKYWAGTLPEKGRLLLTTNPIPNDPQAIQALQEGDKPESHPNTTALLLRSILQQQGLPPVAVLDLHY